MSLGTAFYEVEADDPAQVLCRILGLFAQQDRPVESVVAHSGAGRMHAMLRLSDIDGHRASVLAHKIRALAMVETVELTFAAAPQTVSVVGRRLRLAHDAQHVAAGHLLDVGG